ncbi:hypothetical protein JCM1841_002683 [Sporobolomyces salmonicolor]
MADVSPQEASRIISHMNKEHGESLGHYLEYFKRLPRSQAYANPAITEFTTPSMTLEYGKAGQRKTWTYKFEPPMMAGQARLRLEAMHREAKEGLGLSDVVVDRFSLPASAWMSTMLLLALELWLLLTPSFSLAHILRWQAPVIKPVLSLLGFKPTPDAIGTAVKTFWLSVILVAHLVEVPLCAVPIMRRFNVKNHFARTCYIIATIIGGFPVWTALRDAGVEEETKLKKQ